MLISDRVAAPEAGYFLSAHITRLALYRRAGVETGHALVIGPEDDAPAPRDILRRAGVAEYLGTGRVARVRARR